MTSSRSQWSGGVRFLPSWSGSSGPTYPVVGLNSALPGTNARTATTPWSYRSPANAGVFVRHAAVAGEPGLEDQLAANLVDRVIPEVPVRHWVMSFPMNVRFLLAWRPQLRNEVMAAFFEVVLGWHQERVDRQGYPKGKGGAVGLWHLAGSALNLNPHIHAIVLDGAYSWDDEQERPIFHLAQRPTRGIMDRLVKKVRARVVGILDRWGLLEHVDLDYEDGQVVMQLESVQGRGAERVRGAPEIPHRQRGGLWGWDEYYDLHAGRPIWARDRLGLERLARYVARPPLSLKRLSEQKDGRLRLELRRPWEDGTFFFLFHPMQLLRRIASIIPHPKCHLVHYFGVLAPHAGWRSLIVPDGQLSASSSTAAPAQPANRSSWIPWAELMMRVFGVDPLRCERCGGAMRVRAVVETIQTAKKLLLQVLHYPQQLPLSQHARAFPDCFW